MPLNRRRSVSSAPPFNRFRKLFRKLFSNQACSKSTRKTPPSDSQGVCSISEALTEILALSRRHSLQNLGVDFQPVLVYDSCAPAGAAP